MTLPEGALLFAVAGLAGAQNAVAGGGSFLTFPTLLFLGVPPVAANATNTVALWPGSLASAAAYRRELQGQPRRLVALSLVSGLGGYLGARLLLHTPDASFARLIPWLLLTATLVFAFGPVLAARLRTAGTAAAPGAPATERLSPAGMLAQLVISVYGGFFGGGIGILMMAALTMAGLTDVHRMNALKTWLAACINGVAVVTFVVAGAVRGPEAAVMAAGAIGGGYFGAALARRLDARYVRRFVIVVGAALTVYFFVQG